jgi:hypothetical protein
VYNEAAPNIVLIITQRNLGPKHKVLLNVPAALRLGNSAFQHRAYLWASYDYQKK